MKNLEAIINKISYEVAQVIDENDINKMLGVLSNDGVYALWVFSEARLKAKNKAKDKEKWQEFWDEVFEELEKLEGLENLKSLKNSNKNVRELYEKFFQKLSEDLDKLLFFKDVLEKVLIYARYHAKAKDKTKNGGE